jgi:tyrosine-protein kinase Etk/Wzc
MIKHPGATEQNADEFNLRELIDKYRYRWKWFVAGLILMVGASFLYVRYSVPQYESRASVLVREDEKGGGLAQFSVFKDLGLMGGASNLDNEIEIYKSRKLLTGVIKKLRLNFNTHLIGDNSRMLRGEVYDKSPVSIIPAEEDSLFDEVDTEFELVLTSKNQYQLINKDGANIGTFNFGAVVNSRFGKFIVNKTNHMTAKWVSKSLLFKITPLEDVVNELQEAIKVESPSKNSNVLTISIRGAQIEKNNQIINELIAQHGQSAIEDKNEVAENTSGFIDERMKFIAAELSEVEAEGEKFKTTNKIVDVTSDAALYMTKESETEKAITESSIQLSLSDFMNEFIQKHQGYSELLPANLGFKDQSIILMTTQYNQLVLDRNKLLINSGEKSPNVQKIEGQLAGLKSSLIQSLKNLRTSLQLELGKLKAQEALYESRISSIPQFEREYRDILRQQQIKETLYLYLLQKREENEITLAASVANTRVIDYAYSNGKPISPKKKILYFGALLLGLILPAGIIYLIDLIDNKVHNRKDIEGYGLSVIGEIPVDKTKRTLVTGHGERTGIAEAFRLLRTNISFMLDSSRKEGHVLFVTSTIASEGKSFNSLNIANTLSISGKRTVLVGLDLRAPKLLDYLGLKSTEVCGVSNYITDTSLTLDDILMPVKDSDALMFIPSGAIPPNPAELLMRTRLDELFSTLRSQFDYIVVDTAPVGLVTDTLLISDKSDVIIYVVRANFLDKRMLSIPSKLHAENKLKNMAVLINAVDLNGKGYGYGYGYGYGIENEKKSFLKRLFRR